MSRPTLAVALTAVSIAVLSWVLADRPILDTDYFWHLRTGALIAETGAVPRVDPYSYSAAGARWIDLHWLFQVGLEQLYRAGGHEANRTAGFLLGLLVVGVSAAGLWRSDRPAVCGVALGLLVVTACVRFLLRPDTVSLVFAATVLALLRRDEERNDRWILAVVPIQLLWANVHGFQAVGVALVAMALVAERLSPWVSGGSPARPDRIRRLALVLALGAAAALVNPNGLDGALLPFRQLAMIGPAETRGVFGHAIDELRSPFAALDANSAPALAACTALAVLSFASLLLDRRRFSLFDVFVWLSFFALALSAVRNIALFAVAAAPIFAKHFSAWLDGTARVSRARQRALGAATIAVLAVAAGAVAWVDHARANGPRASSSPALASFWFPERAVDWIARERPPGPLYHRMGDGGFLIWRLWPDYRVLSDGRLEVYGEDLYADLEVVGDGGPDTFQRLDARYHFGTALLHYGLFRDLSLLSWLYVQPDWRLVYVDEVAAVFVRAPEGTSAARWPAVNLDSAIVFEPLEPRPPHPLDLWRRKSRISVLTAVGRLGAARELLEQTRALYRDPALEQMKRLLAQAPDGAGAR